MNTGHNIKLNETAYRSIKECAEKHNISIAAYITMASQLAESVYGVKLPEIVASIYRGAAAVDRYFFWRHDGKTELVAASDLDALGIYEFLVAGDWREITPREAPAGAEIKNKDKIRTLHADAYEPEYVDYYDIGR